MTSQCYQQAIEAAVESKLRELDDIPYGLATGRRYQLAGTNQGGSPMTPEQHRENLRRVFNDIAERLGLHFFQMTDAVLLDQLAAVSVIKDHDTAGLLKSLINSFLIAYTQGETSDSAYHALQHLELLRAVKEKGIGAAKH
ncbi:hypothetical protein [Pseudomonas guariconensis]|uniref:hypothetical protein n=1 Tax=Pseudomonas guariconensis TaxID=1288410 RepID=UPI003906CBE7